MKSIFKDSFNEFMVVIKNVKLTVFTLIAVSINIVLQIYCGGNKELAEVFLLPTMIVMSLLHVYQYITMPKLITNKEKNLFKCFDIKYISYGSSLARVIKSVFTLVLITIGISVSITIVLVVMGIIVDKVFHTSKVMSIIIGVILVMAPFIYMIIAIVRLYLFVPFTVLVDVDKPISYCWELSKGKFWKIFLILLFSIVFPLPSLLLGVVLQSSPIMLFIMCVPINFIVANIVTLVLINALYYFRNQDSVRVIKDTSNIEAI